MASRRILVVDDEKEVVEVLKEWLEQQGYAVDAAYAASGALRLVREHIFDAAILDFNLPDMDGVMLHRQIRQMDEELAQRTLFTSGLIQTELSSLISFSHMQFWVLERVCTLTLKLVRISSSAFMS